MRYPKLIAIEGIDGSGKTVQTELLVNKLQTLGYKADCWSFPKYDGFFGKEIAKMLTGESVRADELSPKSMALWYALDRYETFIYSDSKFFTLDYLVCNRYTLSNVAYQSTRDSSIEEWIFRLEHKTLRMPQPSMNIIFDISTKVSEKNVGEKGERDYIDGADVYESSLDFLSKVRQKYLELAQGSDNTAVLDIMEDSTIKDRDVIHEEVMDTLYKYKVLEKEHETIT